MMGKDNVKKYERIFENKKKNVKIAAIEEMREKCVDNRKAIRILEDLIDNIYNPDDWDLKNEAIITLGQFGNKHCVPHLIPNLADKNPVIRESCAYSLGQIGDKRSVMNLIALLDDEIYSVRENAASALAKLKDPRAIGPLIEKASSENVEVRLSVIPALSAFESDNKVIDILIERLHDESAQVRFPAIIAFNKIKEPRAIDGLVENLESEDPLLQKVAADALVFNLGWGSVEEGKLTRFGKKRKQQLCNAMKLAGSSIDEDDLEDDRIIPQIKNFDNVAENIIDLLSLGVKEGGMVKRYLAELDEYYKVVRKE